MINKFLKLKYQDLFYLKSMNEMIEESKEEINKIKNGWPLHKVLGYIDLSGVLISVKHNVFIPRYETEELILESLKNINNNSKVLDLCTGSGYVAIAIAKKISANIFASDISNEAIMQTKENALINNVNITIIKSDLFENIKDKFDVIISNPPYIPENTILNKSVLEHEPRISLFAGKDGNAFYKRIVQKYENYLNPGGIILFEISQDNSEYLKSQGFIIIKDINNKERIAYKKNKKLGV